MTDHRLQQLCSAVADEQKLEVHLSGGSLYWLILLAADGLAAGPRVTLSRESKEALGRQLESMASVAIEWSKRQPCDRDGWLSML